MARSGLEKLKASQLKTNTPGRYSDGGNLYFYVRKNDDGTITRGWVFRFKLPSGRERDMGLGGLDSIGLAKVREIAAAKRELIAQGLDPIIERDRTNATRRAEESKKAAIPTFDECAADYIAAHRSSWRNPKHAQQWVNTLNTYASPVIGKLRVNEISTDQVMQILKPIWYDKTDTAKRVRGRIEIVLDYAKANKKRDGENPARWVENLKHLLPSPEKIAPVEHHAALDYKSMGEFMRQVRQRDGIGALALEFTVLTCARTGEVLGATWDEIDLDEKVWTVPAKRIKAGKEHQVPLSKAALALLHKVRDITKKIGGPVGASKLVFPNDRSGGQLSENSLSSILMRMKYDDITVHGMRSVFRDWAGEESHFPNDIIEMALAHRVGDKVEQAYRRKTGFQKRRLLAEAWAGYCAKPPVANQKVLAFGKP